MGYIAYLHKEKKSDYGVSFPDFPGCISAGKNLEEARKNAVEALTLHIESMLEDGEAIPEASNLDDLSCDPALQDAVAFLVDVNITDKVERYNITARRSQMDEIDRLAKKLKMTRSAYMVSAALNRKAS